MELGLIKRLFSLVLIFSVFCCGIIRSLLLWLIKVLCFIFMLNLY